MATEQLARELAPDVCVFGISPNELEGTGMTIDNAKEIQRLRGWSVEEAENYRRQGALVPERTSPRRLSEFIAYLLSRDDNHKHLTGVDLYYGN